MIMVMIDAVVLRQRSNDVARGVVFLGRPRRRACFIFSTTTYGAVP